VACVRMMLVKSETIATIMMEAVATNACCFIIVLFF
jgi:hypothetical protein